MINQKKLTKVIDNIDDRINKIEEIIFIIDDSYKEIKQSISNSDRLFKQKEHWVRDEINMLKGKSRRESLQVTEIKASDINLDNSFYNDYNLQDKESLIIALRNSFENESVLKESNSNLKESNDNLRYENKRYRRLLSVRVELLLNSLFRALKGYFTRRK